MNTFFRQFQPLHRAAFDQMGLHDLRHICRADVPVPDRIGIDDHIWPMFALVQATGFIDADTIFQPRRCHSLAQLSMQLRFAIGIAAGAGASGLALIGADKKVPLILCQEISLLNFYCFFHHKASGSATMEGMTPDDLTPLKDDMIAFVEGHGMRHFPALIPEDTPRVWWNDPDPDAAGSAHDSSKESWKDFVEMAKAAGAPMVCIGEDFLDKATLEMLAAELEQVASPAAAEEEMRKLDRLLQQVGRLGHIELAFAHQGILFVHESATEWYREYRAMVDTIDQLQEIIEGMLDDDADEEQGER